MLTDYEAGLKQLERLSQGTHWQVEVSVLADRLRTNLNEETLFGASEQTRSERSRILYSLEKMSMARANTKFSSLCQDPIPVQSSPPPRSMSKPPIIGTNPDVHLLNILMERFDRDELDTLCFHLDIDPEQIPGGTKESRARELIRYTKRRQQIDRLLTVIREIRPDIRPG